MTGRIVKINDDKMKLPIIGKVKIGEQTETACRSLDHFIGYGKYTSYFEKAYPDKPSRIQIIFVSDDIEQSCNERYEMRNDKGDLYGSGDGTNFNIWNETKKTYEAFEVKTDNDKEYLKQASKKCKSLKGWEVILTLQFIMPAIRGVLGLWQFSTKGKASSVNAIRDTFDFVQQKAGSVLNIVFDLTVEMVKSQKPNDPRKYPVVNLISNVSDENLTLVKDFLSSNTAYPRLTDETIEQTKNLLAENNQDNNTQVEKEIKNYDYPDFLKDDPKE